MAKTVRFNYRAEDPSPEQIAERAAEIRSGWDEAEHERRRVGSRGPLTVPIVKTEIQFPKDWTT